MYSATSIFVELASGEWMLSKARLANGGTVVFLRACQIAVLGFGAALLFQNVVDPARSGPISWFELGRQVVDHSALLAGLFASAYVALYTRFASQWSYLAGVYNQVKAAQCRMDADQQVIAQWRAGLIEDADDLHLIRKPMFATIAHDLLTGSDEDAKRVQEAFDRFTPGGAARRAIVVDEAGLVVKRVRSEFERRYRQATSSLERQNGES